MKQFRTRVHPRVYEERSPLQEWALFAMRLRLDKGEPVIFGTPGILKVGSYISKPLSLIVVRRATSEEFIANAPGEIDGELPEAYFYWEAGIKEMDGKAMPSKKLILAEALSKAGLSAMAAKARQGYYDDFESPLAAPAMQLEADLREAGTRPAMAIRARHLKGEFDA